MLNKSIKLHHPSKKAFFLIHQWGISEWGQLLNCTWIPGNLSFRYILFHEKNPFLISAGSALLPSMINAVTVPIIFGKTHFLLISENEFYHEIKCNGITSFMEFMIEAFLICRCTFVYSIEKRQTHQKKWLPRPCQSSIMHSAMSFWMLSASHRSAFVDIFTFL